MLPVRRHQTGCNLSDGQHIRNKQDPIRSRHIGEEPSSPSRKGTNMISDIRELNDDELEVLAGGMDCKWAVIVATIYRASSDILSAAGDTTGAADALWSQQWRL